MVTTEELKEIRSSYKWIKVKKFNVDQHDSFEDKFNALSDHHTKETEFLINKCRELAGELIEVKKVQ